MRTANAAPRASNDNDTRNGATYYPAAAEVRTGLFSTATVDVVCEASGVWTASWTQCGKPVQVSAAGGLDAEYGVLFEARCMSRLIWDGKVTL